ncbi:MAG: alpha/beta hydrolase [Synergistales bacterium]|nr:alpha/beta hydrolase [Synergistales bacterium]
MRVRTIKNSEKGRSGLQTGTISWLCSITFLAALICILWVPGAQAQGPAIVPSKDGTLISYEIHGKGEPALVFVHGWNCDSRYWREQVPLFSKDHRVILIDLAGHGHSGFHRSRYTMKDFGEDVRAVVEATGQDKVILIGHSMGGTVVAEAARIMPGGVLGLIGIDTLENVEYPLTPEELDQMLSPFKQDFRAATRHFVEDMVLPETDPNLKEWIISDMSASLPSAAMSAMEEMMSQYITGEAATMFEEIPLPIVTVNASLWPVNYEGNRRHMRSFDAIVLDGTDHFLMLTQPERFNAALARAIDMVLEKQAR